MPEVSIKFRINGGRGLITPGECINLDGPLTPGGVKGLKFGTNMQGGDGLIEFDIGYRKHSPAKKNDGVEVNYNIERATQHSIMDVQPDEMNGTLNFIGQGHGAHMEKSIVLKWAKQPINAVTGLQQAIWTSGEGNAVQKGFPFLNASQRYFVTTGLADPTDPLITDYDASAGKTIEEMLSEFEKFNDSVRGMFPGREAHPDGLGCHYYHRHRTLNQVPKWYISKEDLRLGKFGVTEDMSGYCNSALVHFDRTGIGPWELTRNDLASQAEYTPGSVQITKLDATSIGTMEIAIAERVGDAYLAIYAHPILKGSITLPLQKLRRVGGGSRWAGFIRGGDIVRVERDYGGYSDILIDTTMVDVDAGTIELGMPNADSLETILAGLLAA